MSASNVIALDWGTSSFRAYLVNSDGTGTLDSPSTVFVTNGNLILAFRNSTSSQLILEIYVKQSTEPGKTEIEPK